MLRWDNCRAFWSTVLVLFISSSPATIAWLIIYIIIYPLEC
nr:MAG TPA: hypothetical protein [Caudoviricetes sp.]